jgi:hypothetical protein
MATGSYEESLSTEDTPDHHLVSLFTRRHQRWSRQLSHPPTRTTDREAGVRRRMQLPRRWERREDEPERVATGVSEARSRQHRGTKTPTLVTLQGRKARGHEFCVERRSAEAVSDVVKRPVPRSCRTEPKTPWDVPAAKVARASRERARCGCTQFVWVAHVGWTHRVSSPPGGRKACW